MKDRYCVLVDNQHNTIVQVNQENVKLKAENEKLKNELHNSNNRNEELKETVKNLDKEIELYKCEKVVWNRVCKSNREEIDRLKVIENKVIAKKKRKKIHKEKVELLQNMIKDNLYETSEYKELEKELIEFVGEVGTLHPDIVLLRLGIAQKKGEKAKK